MLRNRTKMKGYSNYEKFRHLCQVPNIFIFEKIKISISSNLVRSSQTVITMFKVNNRNSRTKCEICLKLTIGVIGVVLESLIVNLEYSLHLALVFLLSTLRRYMPGKIRYLLSFNPYKKSYLHVAENLFRLCCLKTGFLILTLHFRNVPIAASERFRKYTV